MGMQNHLQEQRISCGRTQKQVADSLKVIDPRVDDKLISSFERDLCLPTKTQLIGLCRLFGCLPKHLFKRGSLSLANALDRDEHAIYERIPEIYAFKVDLPNGYRSKLSQARLREYGFDSRSDWIKYCETLLTDELKKERACANRLNEK
ncbi:MAG: hypothetical protein ACC608_09470 [Anaerofustis sp.]